MLILIGAVFASVFLYNKQLNLEAQKVARAADEKLLENKKKCAVDGEKWAEEYLRQESAVARDHQLAYWDEPQFHFSVGLGTCLVRTRSVDDRSSVRDTMIYQHARVTDVYANRAILESAVILTQDNSTTDRTLNEKLTDVFFEVRENLPRAQFVKRADGVMAK